MPHLNLHCILMPVYQVYRKLHHSPFITLLRDPKQNMSAKHVVSRLTCIDYIRYYIMQYTYSCQLYLQLSLYVEFFKDSR